MIYDPEDAFYHDMLGQRCEALESLTAELAAMLGELEWDGDGEDGYYCSICGMYEHDGHSPDCRLSALLARARGGA